MGEAHVARWFVVLSALSACAPVVEPVLRGDACDRVGCSGDLVCNHEGTCAYPGELGTLAEGETCTASVACAYELACSQAGTCVAVEEATGPFSTGATCATSEDCTRGLTCLDATCTGIEVPFWTGISCPEEPSSSTAGPRFVLPEADATSDEGFFSLPFPNDARRTDSGLDLTGFPSPGTLDEDLGDPVGALIDAAASLDGFGTTQTITFRFRGEVDLEGIVVGTPDEGGNVFVVPLDAPWTEQQAVHPVSYTASEGRTAYVCHQHLQITPLSGRPLRPGTPYAAVITTDLLDSSGQPLVADPDLVAMLSAAAPGDARLDAAWQAYAPLRTWLSDSGQDPSTVAGATVFTTVDPSVELAHLREHLDTRESPTVRGLAVCGVDADIYQTAPNRGCGPDDERWLEVQGQISLPQYLSGAAPFATEGGALDLSTAKLSPISTELVTFSLTVPRGQSLPEAGWPVVLVGHDDSDNYTANTAQGYADALTELDLGGGETHGVAVLSYDLHLTGPRAHVDRLPGTAAPFGPYTGDPTLLWDNPLNLHATRNHPVQAVADLMGVVQVVEAWNLHEDLVLPEVGLVRLDLDQLYYVGDGRGGTLAPFLAAWEPAIRALVIGSGGGEVVRSWTEGTTDSPRAAMVRAALADPFVTAHHPALGLVAALTDRGNGVNHARSVLRELETGTEPRHTLQILPWNDPIEPAASQVALARSLDLTQRTTDAPELSTLTGLNMPSSDGPLSENVGQGGTGVVLAYTTDAATAHSTLHDDPDAVKQLVDWITSGLRDAAPTVE